MFLRETGIKQVERKLKAVRPSKTVGIMARRELEYGTGKY